MCLFITRQYNLVLTKGQWCSAAGRVTTGRAESMVIATQSVAIQWRQSSHALCPVCQWDCPSWQRILHGLMDIGQFLVHIRIYIHVGLLNMSSPDAFSEVKMVKSVLAAAVVTNWNSFVDQVSLVFTVVQLWFQCVLLKCCKEVTRAVISMAWEFCEEICRDGRAPWGLLITVSEGC